VRVLAVGAHFDDLELGCGGTIAKHISNGDQVFVFVATKSGFTNHQNQEVRSSENALKEAEKAMSILGVNKMYHGDFKTLEVEFEEKLNIHLIKIIEENEIDLIYSHWTGDIHHDHQAVAKATLHSGRHVKRLLMYRSNWYHSSVDFKGNFYVDISEFWEKKTMAISAHVSEIERTGAKWISFFKNEAENAGQRIGVKYAEVFEVVKWLN
jgi:LmbE family N-acetylglucosaminyl deacetylase